MATSREVAEAYIEVHGDLSEFRKDLNDAGDAARKAGEANATDFEKGWNERIKKGVADKWEAMLNAMYTNNPLDWDKLIGKFDTSDLDAAEEDITHFMIRMRAEGKLTRDEYARVTQAVRAAIKERIQEGFVQEDLAKLTRDHTEAIKENIRFDKIRAQEATKNVAEITKAHTEALKQNAEIDKHITAELKKQQDFRRDHLFLSAALNKLDRTRHGLITQAVRSMFDMKRATSDTHKEGGILHGVFEKIRVSWLRTDSTVRTVLSLILAAAGPMAVALSGAAGSATAIVSSLAMAAGSVVPLGTAFAGMGVMVALAVSGMDDMLARFPQIIDSANAVGDAWQAQAARFGQEWGPALDGLLNTLSTRLSEFDFGTSFGRAMAQITQAFTDVINAPAFTAFMRAMETDIPASVASFGQGIASLADGLMSMMAAAAPVAKLLGDDFARWAGEISNALNASRESGEMTALFMRMRESLLAVLDLAGSLGKALLTLFDLGSESGNRMIRSLAGIVDQFNAWAQTEAGRQKILEWFDNAERIIRALEPVVVGVGKALDILVTPFAIAQFENLTQLVGELLPILGEVLKVISDLGILNIVAELLLAVGKAIQPLLPPLGELARTVGPLVQELFRALAPILTEVVEAAVPLVEEIVKLVQWLAPQLVPALIQLAEAATPVVKSILELATVIIDSLMPVIGPVLMFYITATVEAFKVLAGGITFVVDVITTVVTAIIDFFTNFQTHVTNFQTAVGQAWTDFWTGVQNQFTTFITGFQAGWDAFWGGLGTNIQAIWQGIITFFTEAFINLQAGWDGFVATFQAGWDAFWNGLDAGIKAIWTVITTYLSERWQAIVDGVNDVLIKPFQQFWDAFWGGLDPDLKAVIMGIVASIQAGWKTISDGLNNFIRDFTNWWNDLWAKVGSENDKRWRETVDGFNRWATDINNTVNKFVADVIGSWNRFWGDLFNRTSQGWNEMIAGFNRWASDINGTVNRFISDVVGGWNRFWGDVFSRAANGWNEIVGGFNRWAADINNTVNGFINNVIGRWNSFWGELGNRLSVAFQTMVAIAGQKINEIGDWFNRLPSIVGAALSFFANQLWNAGRNAIQSLANAISSAGGAVFNAIAGVVNGAIDWAKRLLGIASPSKVFALMGRQTGEGFIKGVASEEADVRSATEQMLDGIFDSFDKSKALAAGQDAGRGLAEGLESSKARIAAAIGKIDPAISSAFTASVTATGVRAGTTATAAATNTAAPAGVIIEEGAIQLVSKAASPEILGGIVLDGLSDLFADRSKV